MSGQNSFKTFNPLKNTFNTEIYYADTAEDLKNKIELAAAAADILSKTSWIEISTFLQGIKAQLISRKASISKMYLSETGLDYSRFEIEFTRTLNQLTHFSDFIQSKEWGNLNELEEYNGGKILLKKKLPIGPIMVMGASNFPLAYSTIGGDSVAAISARCPVILKAHPYHAGTSIEVYKAISKAIVNCGLPPGTFSHILDDGYEKAAHLSQHKTIKGIGFTGSQLGGEAIIDLVNSRKESIPVFAEMGSINPVFILDLKESSVADLAHKLAHAVCNDRGQFCTKPGVIFVPNNRNGNALCNQLKNNIINYDSGPMLHPKIKENFEMKTSAIKTQGISIHFYESDKKEDFHVSNKVMIVGDKEYKSLDALRKEIFGPFTSIVMYDQDPQVYLKAFDGQLTCSVFSDERENENSRNSIIQLAMHKAGRVIINDVPTGVSVCKNMHHGGPYPASSDSRFTAVGSDSIKRFIRDVTIQLKVN